MVKITIKEILFYRKLRDLKFAMKWMCSYASNYNGGEYQKFSLSLANICLLNGDIKSAKFYYDKYLSGVDPKEQTAFQNLSIESLLNHIKITRKMWHCKSSMKKCLFTKLTIIRLFTNQKTGVCKTNNRVCNVLILVIRPK